MSEIWTAATEALKEAVAHTDKEVHALLDRIKALEVEVQTLKQKESALQYKGVFQRAIQYERGNIVTHDGSAWIKVNDGKDGAPGTCESWQLLVKRGKDGRDAR